ncbi:MAG: sigma-54-dependent Fis family transcriptional regulator [Deltaproteobacteria bacterium]|nr:sigma-54-dependent Fis family transcriptional regulator [Deltaproteobacteria bacterium]
MNAGRVLILDDNDAIRVSVSVYLEDSGFETRVAANLAEAHRALDSESFDAAIVDYMLPDGTAFELLQRLREAGSSLPVIVLTGHGSIDLAVRAIQAGAEHFLTKPLQLPTLLEVLQRTTDGRRTQRREAATRSKTRRDALDPFAGSSEVMKRLADDARRVVTTDKPVLVLGETGSGKGVLAAWLHANSPRASEAIVDINCAGLNAQLLESELFGHERGAFTGAHAAKTGLIEVAHRGTLFLDEMGDLDLAVQPKLLKVLEEKRFRRLGSVRDRVVDIRLVAATHVDLAQAVAERRFRSDLYYRINALVLKVPPLRERPDDIPLLARHMLESARGETVELAADAMRALCAYAWPGNVRELRNVLERAVLLSDRRVLSAADLRLGAGAAGLERDAGPLEIVSLEENERRYLARVLEAKNGRVDECARALGVPLSSLYQRLKRHGVGRGRA